MQACRLEALREGATLACAAAYQSLAAPPWCALQGVPSGGACLQIAAWVPQSHLAAQQAQDLVLPLCHAAPSLPCGAASLQAAAWHPQHCPAVQQAHPWAHSLQLLLLQASSVAGTRDPECGPAPPSAPTQQPQQLKGRPAP